MSCCCEVSRISASIAGSMVGTTSLTGSVTNWPWASGIISAGVATGGVGMTNCGCACIRLQPVMPNNTKARSMTTLTIALDTGHPMLPLCSSTSDDREE